MSYERTTKVSLHNTTDKYFLFRVQHQYASEKVDDSQWLVVKPKTWHLMLESIKYWTGAFTTGTSYWKVQGLELKESDNANDLTIKFDGKQFTLGEFHETNRGDWSSKMLHSDDTTGVDVEVSSGSLQIISRVDGPMTLSF